MLYKFSFTSHSLERYYERIEPMYPNIEPKVFIYQALLNGYNFYELDKDTQKLLRGIKCSSRNGNVFIFYRSFAFIFNYHYTDNTYYLVTVFDVPSKARFRYNDYTK